MKLFLKGTRCDTPKCAVDRRDGVPGMHRTAAASCSEYGIRLREKQKVKRFYGIFERQFRQYFALAATPPENTGEAPERSWSAGSTTSSTGSGFAPSRGQARQLVRARPRHGQRPQADIPSFLVSPAT